MKNGTPAKAGHCPRKINGLYQKNIVVKACLAQETLDLFVIIKIIA